MPNDEEFAKKAQLVGKRLEDVADRVNFVRQTLWSRAQLMREAIKPAVGKLVPQGTPRLVGRSENSTAPMGAERAQLERQPVTETPTPPKVKRKPAFPILAGILLGEPKRTEAPRAEAEQPPAAPEERPKRPALF